MTYHQLELLIAHIGFALWFLAGYKIGKAKIISLKNIFKRQKSVTPTPNFDDNWKQDRYEQNIKDGVISLQKGMPISIMDNDGRGYELALEIKRRFILEYQKQLSEKIKIRWDGSITISFNSFEFTEQ